MNFYQINSLKYLIVLISSLVFSVLVTPYAMSQDYDHSLEHTSDFERQWLAGDHHIHSRYSVGWNEDTNPPTPILGGDARYPIPMNAVMARLYGLDWMVTTDHGGPNHSKVNLEMAYPELLISRRAVPDLVQFYGMEFDTPGADHSTIIMPYSNQEADLLFDIESNFNSTELYPADSTWDTEQYMFEALNRMNQFPKKPLIIANHPSRSASDSAQGAYGNYSPQELRNWNDAYPDIAVGMAGAPGHQAATLNKGGNFPRGGYGFGRYPTMGGFDQMTARLGGFWDSMLGEGREWWITANSDFHYHWSEGYIDFWPGEYSKTYVFAHKNYDDIIHGIRNGRVFVTLGDLISELYVTVSSSVSEAEMGGLAEVQSGSNVEITIRFLDPDVPNFGGYNPSVNRIDLIVGEIMGPVSDQSTDTNPTTRVEARFTEDDWITEGRYQKITYVLKDLKSNSYIRVRGTNTEELEPEPDTLGENPWSDLWFYSNPVFLEITE